MYTLLIVDDEQIICNGLKQYIKWESLKIDKVYTVNSVDEALNKLSNYHIDVVLTDICMPHKDGLYLTEKIRQLYSHIKVLMLSGYDDFIYAKKAIHLGVEDYLLKPVNFDELSRTVIKLIEKLEEEKQILEIKDEMKQHKTDQFFTDLIFGNGSNKSFHSTPAMMPSGGYYIIRISINGCGILSEMKNKLRIAINNAVKDVNTISAYYLFNTIAKELTMIIYVQSEEALIDLTSYISSKLKVAAIFGVSSRKDILRDIADAYNEAGIAIEYQCIKNLCNVIFYSQIKRVFLEPSKDFTKIQKRVTALLPLGNQDLRLYIYSLLDAMVIDNVTYATLIRVYICIFNYYIRLNDKHDIDVYIHIKRLLSSNSYDEIKRSISEYLDYFNMNELKGETMITNIIESAKDYIEAYYYQNITLNMLAQTLYIHPNYLSRLFKEKTGQNFSKYLLDVRLRTAKDLLANKKLTIYQISEMVGYGSKKYFVKVFKELNGLTPKEFRDKIFLVRNK